jgi:hypothetical protein
VVLNNAKDFAVAEGKEALHWAKQGLPRTGKQVLKEAATSSLSVV